MSDTLFIHTCNKQNKNERDLANQSFNPYATIQLITFKSIFYRLENCTV